jgi:Kef-type K+ transport system membrane component KefB
MLKKILCLIGLLGAAASAWASPGGADPMTAGALYLALVLVVAKLGSDLADRLGQPAVLGELLGGVVLGNLGLAGVGALDAAKTDPLLGWLAQVGLLLLLFDVGLETTVAQMRQVGMAAFAVALAGLAASFALGWGAAAWLLPQASPYVHAFLGAAICATSVGITARVLKDLGQGTTRTSRVILGAAAVDDLLVLVVLAVMRGVFEGSASRAGFPWMEVAAIVAKSAVFLGLSMALGVYLSLKFFNLVFKLRGRGALLAGGLAFCFALSWLAGAIGLAPLIGAFAAGVILEDLHYRDFVNRGEQSLVALVQPITSFLVPVFFVLMGMRTDLRALAQPGTIPLALGLTLAAVVGKQACSVAALGRGLNAFAVGIGMIPRGEVSLVFASLGLSMTLGGRPLLDPAAYSAIVLMVIFSTLLTPPALKWSLNRE